MIGTSSLLITAAALASLLVVEETGPTKEGMGAPSWSATSMAGVPTAAAGLSRHVEGRAVTDRTGTVDRR